MLDIDAYLHRIGYSGRLEPSLEVLRELQFRHATTIAFENLNTFLGLPISLELEDLQQKLLREQRGGYCYEQNLLFKAVLEWIGFDVIGLVARVLWNEPHADGLPRSHMLLRVEVEAQAWLADVGFGAAVPLAPVLLSAGRVSPTPLEHYRVIERDGQWQLQIESGEGWREVYEFDLQAQRLGDYKVQNWYVSTHPDSKFVNGLTLSRAALDRRYSLSNTQFTVRDRSGQIQRQNLLSARAIAEVIEQVFRVDTSALPELVPTLEQRLFSDARQGGIRESEPAAN